MILDRNQVEKNKAKGIKTPTININRNNIYGEDIKFQLMSIEGINTRSRIKCQLKG